MKKRGKVLRDPHSGPGLLIAEGQQHQFTLEGVWRSEIPPTPGLAVDVEFDGNGQIIAITAIPESQLAKERAEAALAVARERGGVFATSMVAKFGLPKLVAAGCLVLGWLVLTAVSVQLGPLGKLEFTFWQVLGFLNASNPLEALDSRSHGSAGIYGFLALVALAAPFVHHFWKDKRAVLGGLLPLAFMIVIGLMVRSSLQNAMGGGDGAMGEMARQARDEAMKAISLGLGTYVSVVTSLYFAGTSTMKYLAGGQTDAHAYEKPHKVAA
jgi:hypothetical protein